MNSVQIEQETYEMPPREGISIAFFPDVGGARRSRAQYAHIEDLKPAQTILSHPKPLRHKLRILSDIR